MRKWLVAALCLSLWFGFVGTAAQSAQAASSKSDVKVYMNGYDISEWKWENNYIMVPLYAFDDYSYFDKQDKKDKQDITYNWDAKNKTVWVYPADKTKTVKLVADEAHASVNGKQVNLDAPVRIIDGHTYVPLRFISEALGGKVVWNEAKKMAVIRTPERVNRDEVIRTGSLEDARKEVLRLPTVYPNRELLPRAEGFAVSIQFPEGEALRYYYSVKDIMSYIVINSDGLAEVIWQGRMGSNSDKFIEEFGKKPEQEDRAVYFSHSFPVQDAVTYGKIGGDGSTTQLGKFEVSKSLRSHADAITAIPGEKRTDGEQIDNKA
ncbi:copper amine oxidase N-terminal domain-containing protein [Paenibacillus sp. MER TA 81-3]|uniref:copper amine oxidase N-terminal domain-containing protein n=1 Tax=Paenibacillus sp. MER TA 81-3 TaxID=2939573 RepID=UPI00203E0167|nr:copper amine oxidase N-terminal domain-containing protein [Paenibacillus sp. MER TA 81-3]MCM3341918.1 copper amine oxidase N-terminal domain-containing protein [Paenibacillus sp. MER TA 81-3]